MLSLGVLLRLLVPSFSRGVRPPAPVSVAVFGHCRRPPGHDFVVFFAPTSVHPLPDWSYALLEGETWSLELRNPSWRCWRALCRVRVSPVFSRVRRSGIPADPFYGLSPQAPCRRLSVVFLRSSWPVDVAWTSSLRRRVLSFLPRISSTHSSQFGNEQLVDFLAVSEVKDHIRFLRSGSAFLGSSGTALTCDSGLRSFWFSWQSSGPWSAMVLLEVVLCGHRAPWSAMESLHVAERLPKPVWRVRPGMMSLFGYRGSQVPLRKTRERLSQHVIFLLNPEHAVVGLNSVCCVSR